MSQAPKYFFIGGCGRSGTTLVQKIICAHSQVNGAEEFGYGEGLLKLYRDMNLKADMGMLDSYLTNKDQLKEDFRGFYNSFFRKLNSDKVQFVSEKTPSNIFVIDELLTLFPDAMFINVIRDGRDVVASHMKVKRRYKNKGRFAGFNVVSVCRLWNRSIDQYFKYKDHSRVYSIAFESLLDNPTAELEKLCSFLGLDFEDQLLSPEKMENDAKAHINDIWYTKNMFGQSFNTENIGKWRRMNPFRKLVVNSLLAGNLSKLDYPIGTFYSSINRSLNSVQRMKNSNSSVYRLYLKIRLFFS